MNNLEIFKNISIVNKGKLLTIICALQFSFSLISCEDFVDINSPKTEIIRQDVFESNETAISAVRGIYYEMTVGGWASGGLSSVTNLNGLSADELEYFGNVMDRDEFFTNATRIDNSQVKDVWDEIYNTIYLANAVIEGVQSSDQIAEEIRDQLIGESKFIRAFCHFYLVNLFGGIPVITSTDYRTNNAVSRSMVDEVYNQIVTDLGEAQTLLTEDYKFSENDKIVPNKVAATALLARVYLYRGNWLAAEEQANSVIDNTNYGLENNLNDVFLANSSEAIWQLVPIAGSTSEASAFINSGTPRNQALTDDLVNSFEVNDDRFINWVGSSTDGSTTWYHPFKYKIDDRTPRIEFSMVLRLAEQYLIRAEAKAQQNELADAIADLDIIRERAGLPLIQDTSPAISQAALLLAIQQERRIELFTEWGHRWYDLKRAGRADAILSTKKLDWQSTDILLPIPQEDIEINRNLLPQNSGY